MLENRLENGMNVKEKGLYLEWLEHARAEAEQLGIETN